MELKGIHHVSALTAKARENVDFYTKVLGLRLVKKTVNQDDTSVYHLFYGDEKGNPGTELTFFEIPMIAKKHEGTNSISATSLRVPNDRAIAYWKQRFEELNIEHEEIANQAGRFTLAFKDFEGQHLILVSDENNEGVQGGIPWKKAQVPAEYGIVGLGPVKLTVKNAKATIGILTELLGFRIKGNEQDTVVLETGEGGTGAEIHVEEKTDFPPERQGRGSVHHVAFRVDNEEELHEWIKRIREAKIPNSGFVDRFYFRSLYFREPNGILFELATDGPGFDSDEDIEHLGESLALPPFLEPKREEIEAKLKPLR
ncbi:MULTISPECIES: ring-cleaving dioxygenase [Bacillus]|uniref:Ring-cleaving dioxygenase n=2 Tax=Bacillus TaxID=1386 RepID=A0A0M3RA71_9BACI|nr:MULTISPECIES: ring-cleaving dioxygenase [Bacillus]ALC82666.1 ring-cleaving dioxygenase [Bacillus gobiensis]MBP1081613.1 glyoxalase family protein [Bacillus capparidis]MED1096272.1 ring-cleaving dioxygenase [Bacillus capparidis]